MAKRGLGKGLGALIPTIIETEGIKTQEIPIGDIVPNPNQPRKSIDESAFQELVNSVREFGIIQPILIRPKGAKYELVAGERRWKASKEAGLKSIPAVIRESSNAEALEMALIENIQRENLNAIEEAEAYGFLINEYKITQAEVAKKVGKNRATITNSLRLLNLPKSVQQLVIDGGLSSGHARSVLSLDKEEKQIQLAERVMTEGLSVRQTESLASLWKLAKSKKEKTEQSVEFRHFSKRLGESLSAKVKVKMTLKKGKIEIIFKDLKDFERISQLLLEEDVSES